MDLKCQPIDMLDFSDLGQDFGNWMSRQMDLVGGWLPGIEEIYTPKTYGYFSYTTEEFKAIESLVKDLSTTYIKVGKIIQQQFGAIDKLQESFTQQELSVLQASLANKTIFPKTIRADVVFDQQHHPHVVEVNTDNVAGIENLFLYHSFFGAHKACRNYHESIAHSKNHLLAVMDNWLISHYRDFLNRKDINEFPDIKDATIAIVYDDRDHCFFLARVLANILGKLGYKVIVRRPENIQLNNGQVVAERPLSDKFDPVQIIWKHWLFLESFDEQGEFIEKFSPIIEADSRDLALVLNPIKDRLLFSKSILALVTDSTSIFHKCANDGLVQSIPVTELFSLDEFVIKPLSKFGGEGVLIGNSEERFIRQARINTPKINAWYRSDSGITRKELATVHGVLIYITADGVGHLGGIMGRAGPNPVVNFSRGAQVFGSITP